MRPPPPVTLPDIVGYRAAPDSAEATALALEVLHGPLEWGGTVERDGLLARVEPHYDDHAGGGLRWHRGVTVYVAAAHAPTDPAPPPEQPEHVSPAGRAFIARWEGRVLRVYLDSRKLPTCGVGHLLRPGDGIYGSPVGMPISPETCDHLLAADLGTVEAAIREWIHVPLSTHEFDALASWAFNCGTGPLRSSNVTAALNGGDYDAVPGALLAWCHAGAAVDNGLLARRVAEGELWRQVDAAAVDAGLTDEDRARALAMLISIDVEAPTVV